MNKYYYNDTLNEYNENSILESVQFRNVLIFNSSYIGFEGILSVFDYSDEDNYDAAAFINTIDINWNDPYIKQQEGPYIKLGINTTGNLLKYIKESYSMCGINLIEYVKFADAKTLYKERTDRINELNTIINKWLGRKFTFVDNDNTSTEIGRIISLNSDTQLSLINTLKFISTQNNEQYCKFDILLSIEFDDTEIENINIYQQINLTNNQNINITYNNETLFTISKNSSYFTITNVKQYNDNCKFNLTIEQTNKIDNDDNAKLNYIINFNKKINIDRPELMIYDICYNGTSIYDTNNLGLITDFNRRFENGSLGTTFAENTGIYINVYYYYWIKADWGEHVGFLFNGGGNTYEVYIKEDNQTLKNSIETMLRHSFTDNINFSWFNHEDINFEFIVRENGIPNQNDIKTYMFFESAVNIGNFNQNTTTEAITRELTIDIKRSDLDQSQSETIYLGYSNNIEQDGSGKLTLKKISIPPTSYAWLNGNENAKGRWLFGIDYINELNDKRYNIFNNPDNNTNYTKLSIIQEAPTPILYASYIATRRQLPLNNCPKNCLTYEPFIYYEIDGGYYTFVEIDNHKDPNSPQNLYTYKSIKRLAHIFNPDKYKPIIKEASDLNNIPDPLLVTPDKSNFFTSNQTNFIDFNYSYDGFTKGFKNARYLRKCFNPRFLNSMSNSTDDVFSLCGTNNRINVSSTNINITVYIGYHVIYKYQQGKNNYIFDTDKTYTWQHTYAYNNLNRYRNNKIISLPGCCGYDNDKNTDPVDFKGTYESIFKEMIRDKKLYYQRKDKTELILNATHSYAEYQKLYGAADYVQIGIVDFMKDQWNDEQRFINLYVNM